MGELAALTWLPDLVAHASELLPDVVLEPCVDLGAALEQRLESGELDFAVVAGYSSRKCPSHGPPRPRWWAIGARSRPACCRRRR